MNSDIIIWDADGTILDDIDVINSIALQVADILKIPHCNNYRELRVALNNSEFGKTYFQDIIDFICSAVVFRSNNFFVFDGIIELIKKIDASHFIVSGGFSDVSINVLKNRGVLNLFSGIFGRELGNKGNILRKFTADEAIFISDSLKDLRRAKEIHPMWKYIAVTWGIENRNNFDCNDVADVVCNSIDELNTTIKTLIGD